MTGVEEGRRIEIDQRSMSVPIKPTGIDVSPQSLHAAKDLITTGASLDEATNRFAPVFGVRVPITHVESVNSGQIRITRMVEPALEDFEPELDEISTHPLTGALEIDSSEDPVLPFTGAIGIDSLQQASAHPLSETLVLVP